MIDLHKINNLLSIISGCAEMMIHDTTTEHERRLLEEIVSCSLKIDNVLREGLKKDV